MGGGDLLREACQSLLSDLIFGLQAALHISYAHHLL